MVLSSCRCQCHQILNIIISATRSVMLFSIRTVVLKQVLSQESDKQHSDKVLSRFAADSGEWHWSRLCMTEQTCSALSGLIPSEWWFVDSIGSENNSGDCTVCLHVCAQDNPECNTYAVLGITGRTGVLCENITAINFYNHLVQSATKCVRTPW